MKKLTIAAIISATIIQLVSAQESELKLPNNIDDLVVDGNTVDIVPLDPEDFLPQAKGKISRANALVISEMVTRLQGVLNQVPQGRGGQGHNEFALLQKLVANFQNISTTKDRASLFATIPQSLAIFTSDSNRGSKLSEAGGIVSEVRDSYIEEAAFDVSENTAVLPQGRHDLFINMLCNGAIVQETDWEYEEMPIDAAGVFVVDAVNAAKALKTKSLDQINTFLGGSTDNSFFERYEAGGNGMDVLKAKYAANKAAIQAKLAEVVAYAAQLEAKKKTP